MTPLSSLIAPETQVSTSGPAPQPPPTSTTSVTSLEHWEADLIALLRVGTVEVQIGPRKKNAQEFADRLDAVRLLENGYIGPPDHGPRLSTTETSLSRKGDGV